MLEALVAAAASRSSPASFLRTDLPRHAVTLTLIAGDGTGNNGFNFDGYGRGELLVRVPRGWRVNVLCRNGGSRRASCAIVRGPLSTAPAFPGASVANPTVGIESGGSARFVFTATRAGVYRIASMVPGQMQARMWDVLEVTRAGRPSITARAGP
jgi:hypothetical protein